MNNSRMNQSRHIQAAAAALVRSIRNPRALSRALAPDMLNFELDKKTAVSPTHMHTALGLETKLK